ncbi:MAG: hypothetical protein JWQ38_2539 [Flavipsychrobacter sp.]|nr:hypothetical protein [Flavipsychrobacter sp.]
MGALSLFLWKSIVVSGLLMGWYLLGLRGRRLHQYNRFFLISVLFFSLTIPFLHFRLFDVPRFAADKLAPVALMVQAGDNSNAPAVQTMQYTQLNWPAIAGIAAAGISMILLVILLVRIVLVRRMCRQQPTMQLSGINLVLTDSPKAPFAFLKYLFWKKSIPLNSEAGQLIFRHELIHIKQGHTYDKLVCQALTCIFWFNPFYWMIQKELNMVHEFIADEYAVGNGDTEAFAMMLLQSHNDGSYLAPEHHFFSSPVKRRLAMLQRAATPSYAAVRRFMVLPLLAGAVLLFSFGVRNSGVGHIEPAKKTITVMLDAGHGGNDAGSSAGSYTEKEICLKYAKRLKELAPSYNVAVQLTRDNDRELPLAERVAIANKAKPDVFISLHTGDEAGTEKAKGDVDIYVSGTNAHAKESSNYSSAIFQAMAENGVIPGMSTDGSSAHSKGCNCATCTNAAHQDARISSTEKDGNYVLKNATVPAMVMIVGNMNNNAGMKQLANGDKMDLMCDAVLKGIVEGAAEKTPSNTVDLLLPQGNSKCR